MNDREKISLRGCLAVLIGAMFCLYQFFLQTSPAFMFAPLMADLSLTLTQIGVLSSSLLYTYLLLQMPAGWLVDRCGVRFSFTSGVSVLVLGQLVFSHASSLETALLGRLLLGVGSSTAVVGSLCLMSAWFPKRWFAVGVGIIEMASMFGGTVSGIVTPQVVEFSGWRGAMELYSLVGLVLLFLVISLVRDNPLDKPAVKDQPTLEQGGQTSSFYSALGSRDIWLSALFGLSQFGLISAFGMMWGVHYLQCLYPDCHDYAAKGVALFFAGVAVGTVISGWLVSLWGSYRNCMVTGALTALLLLLVMLYLPLSLLLMTVLLFVLGLTLGCYGLAFVASKNSLSVSCLATVMAFINSSMLLSSQVLQPLVGRILDSRAVLSPLTLVDFQVAFLPLIILAVLALLCSLLLREARECLP